ncbi:flagellar basal body rod protein FlgB [Thermodesulfobacteriota bacterium]
MASNPLFSNQLIGRTITILSKALDFRAARHNVIAGNLANMDTPGYTPKEATFDSELRRAVGSEQLRLKTTNRKHFPPSMSDPVAGKKPFTIQPLEGDKMGNNKLNLDMEMAKMAQNNLLYEATSRLLAKKFEALKTVIDAGRR